MILSCSIVIIKIKTPIFFQKRRGLKLYIPSESYSIPGSESGRLVRTLLDILHGEGQPAHLILAQADDGDAVAQRQDVFHMIDPVLRDLGDMHHAFLARRKLDEGAEFLDGNDGTGKDHAFLEIGRDDADHLDGLVDRVQIRTAYADGTVILDIDGSAGAGDDLIDRLASLTDHIADLHRINGDLDNLRRGSAMHGSITSFKIYSRASFVRAIASSTIGRVRP